MLHLITEVGKPGKHDFERRHFPDLSNCRGVISPHKPRGRRYIPHGASEDVEFKPHPPFMSPQYTECGLDWKSKIRRIPSPRNPEHKPEIWPEPWYSLRTFPWMSQKTKEEWVLHPEYDQTVRCTWDNKHKSTETSDKEFSHKILFGKGRNVAIIDKRNGIGLAAPGDKPYQAVEYSSHFHKYGSTLPVVTFGGNMKKATDTFIPLQEMPPYSKETYKEKEHYKQYKEAVACVKHLENWRPATPLVAPNPAM